MASAKNSKQKGLPRRDLEWHARDLVRGFPSDQQPLAKALADMMVNLIHKNNEALARVESSSDARDDEEHF